MKHISNSLLTDDQKQLIHGLKHAHKITQLSLQASDHRMIAKHKFGKAPQEMNGECTAVNH